MPDTETENTQKACITQKALFSFSFFCFCVESAEGLLGLPQNLRLGLLDARLARCVEPHARLCPALVLLCLQHDDLCLDLFSREAACLQLALGRVVLVLDGVKGVVLLRHVVAGLGLRRRTSEPSAVLLERPLGDLLLELGDRLKAVAVTALALEEATVNGLPRCQ